jgi:hypothetical protein
MACHRQLPHDQAITNNVNSGLCEFFAYDLLNQLR